MGYIINCNLCGYCGDETDEKFYNVINGVELIDILRTHRDIPKEIKDICINCFYEVLENSNFFEEIKIIEKRLQIGL
jgi:hypothetical protein